VASDRVVEVQHALEARRPGASISVELAEPDDDDTLETVVARAHTALYRAKARAATLEPIPPRPCPQRRLTGAG
jgi:GGDEF domain-containing protein